MKFKHKIALFIAYLVLFLAITAMIDYYAYDIISPLLFVSLSLIAAIISTYIHIKNKEKSQIDVIAKEIEEII